MRFLAIPSVAVACLLAPASGHAVVTIGSDLTGANNIGFGCLGQSRCTAAQTSPGGKYVSPVNGQIVHWRTKISAAGGDVLNLRVLRPGPSVPGSYSAVGRGPDAT